LPQKLKLLAYFGVHKQNCSATMLTVVKFLRTSSEVFILSLGLHFEGLF
jgi:hypothetical protein